jgi:transcriptional regulator with XRE-family HTH domain
MESPAAWIRDERARLGLSTRDLARLAGVSYPTVSRIENGHIQPRWSTLEKIFEVLGRPLAPSPDEREQPRLADLSDAWTKDAAHGEHPDWTRLRALVDQLRLRPALTAQAILPEPPRSRSALMDALLAAVAEKLADDAGISRPRWTRERPPLREPWCAAARPSKQAEAAACAPAQFLRRGLLIAESAIWRERELVSA